MVRPLCDSENDTSGRASAMRRTTSAQWPYSVCSDFKNLRRAGVLKYRSCTSTVVPCAPDEGETLPLCEPTISQAWAASIVREVRVTAATEAMEASASPRKPRVPTFSRSLREAIFEVAWRARASGNCSLSMPRPLSVMAMRFTPPSSRRTVICVAPESSAFSSSSLTTADGRSTTSPAAICEISWSGRAWIGRWGVMGAFMP